MTIVTVERLDQCTNATMAQLQANPTAYQQALAEAGGSEQQLAHNVVDACLKQLGAGVTADQLTACSKDVLTSLQADPAAYQQAIADAGGAVQLATVIIGNCLEKLQIGGGGGAIVPQPVKAEEPKKSYWGWYVGGVIALAAVGTVAYVAMKDDGKPAARSAKRNPTHRAAPHRKSTKRAKSAARHY